MVPTGWPPHGPPQMPAFVDYGVDRKVLGTVSVCSTPEPTRPRYTEVRLRGLEGWEERLELQGQGYDLVAALGHMHYNRDRGVVDIATPALVLL